MSFFKAYDMRGTFGVDFDLSTVYAVGRHLPAVVRERNDATGGAPLGKVLRVLVGRDCRATSPAVAGALIAGLRDAGAEVVDLGLSTTPMVYFFTAEEDFDASVMITASHNPPTDNGLKVSRKGALPMGYESGLGRLEQLVNQYLQIGERYDPEHAAEVLDGSDSVRLEKYVEWLRSHSDMEALKGLKFAVDCSDGMASILVHKLFGDAPIYLNDVPNGDFPHHAPNPLLAESREQLAAAVRTNNLDCGVIFDGDADRCMFVDERGNFIQPDYLIPVLAATFDEKTAIIHDVRTSRGAIEALARDGYTPVMGKVGHAYAKVLLREVKAVCGGELAGHYYFRDFHFCDSGEWAALRLLGAFAKSRTPGEAVSTWLAPICSRYANSGERNFKVADKQAAIARVLDVAATLDEEIGRSDIDGYRLEYKTGWISIRQSNTEPYLRLLVECDTAARLDEWLAKLSAAI